MEMENIKELKQQKKRTSQITIGVMAIFASLVLVGVNVLDYIGIDVSSYIRDGKFLIVLLLIFIGLVLIIASLISAGRKNSGTTETVYNNSVEE
jgi:ABC-type transport system involved in multi-copper enzyme maturation permease subunit